MPARCKRWFLLQILLLAQHVSGTTMPIIRSSRVLTGGCCLWYLVLMMGVMVPETCWASNKICNKNHLLHLVGILFPHINDDPRSKSHQIQEILVCPTLWVLVPLKCPPCVFWCFTAFRKKVSVRKMTSRINKFMFFTRKVRDFLFFRNASTQCLIQWKRNGAAREAEADLLSPP
jgi:hypothetical protein